MWYLLSQSPPARKLAPSEEAQPSLELWTGFEPVRLETPRTPKHAWFHCTTLKKRGMVFYDFFDIEFVGKDSR
ncbi:hypothetical protein E2C01_082641 [Portunus trituberculatus]|uniref:Uncharacterized protein n=1 Tax=Portunus trituberculatus TaxID=210409 RepID=A0A5B7J4B7_PORTR|nr:hypothetical protein [Portunus trituberculatus]